MFSTQKKRERESERERERERKTERVRERETERVRPRESVVLGSSLPVQSCSLHFLPVLHFSSAFLPGYAA